MAKKSKKSKKDKKQQVSAEDDVDATSAIPHQEGSDGEEENMKEKEETTNVDDDVEAAEEEPTKSKRKRKRKRKAKSGDDEDEKEKAAAASNSQPSELLRDTTVDRTVYVEGIPFDVKPDQLKEFFATHDIVDVLEMRLPTWQDSGRLRGYGHVVFDTVESHTKALSLSGEYLQKRYLTIQPAKAPKASSSNFTPSIDHDPFAPPPKDCKTIFCHNLPYHAAEEEISEVFSKFGTIVPNGVRIARNSVNRQSKGFCYIDFEQPDEAKEAVTACATSRIHVGGRLVRVDYDTGRIKGSFKAESGRLWTKHVQKGDDDGENGNKQKQQRRTPKRSRHD